MERQQIYKKKPTPPAKPIKPEKALVGRYQKIEVGKNIADVITKLQALPDGSNLQITDKCHDSYCSGGCSDSELVARWDELETDDELAAKLRSYQMAMTRYETAYIKYLAKLAEWETWYEANKDRIIAKTQKVNAAEVIRLEKVAQDAQKNLQAAQKRLQELRQNPETGQ